MTITHEPVHIPVHRTRGQRRRPHPHATQRQPRIQDSSPRVDVFLPRRKITIDTTFWQHRSIFAGSQEQLNDLRREADARAAQRAQAAFADYVASARADAERAVLAAHRPIFRRLKPIVHVGLVPLLWTITTCHCGERWPCNTVKQHLRSRLGWTADITEHLKALTDRLPKPATRWSRLRSFFDKLTQGVGGSRADNWPIQRGTRDSDQLTRAPQGHGVSLSGLVRTLANPHMARPRSGVVSAF